MKVRVVIPFVDDRSYRKGEEFELPEGKDYLHAGLVVPVVQIGPEEKAIVQPAETRSKGKAKKKQP